MFESRVRTTPSMVTATLLGAVFVCATASSQEIDPEQLLKAMSAEIAALDAFVISGDGYSDARLPAGQVIEHASEVRLTLQRPGSFRMTNREAELSREVFFDEGLLTVFNSDRGFYAQTTIPEGTQSALDFAVNEVGIEEPLLDLISQDVAGHLLEDAEETSYLGHSLVRGEIYHHLAIRFPEVDMQVWVAVDGPALPGKLSISSKWEGGAPRFVAFLDWEVDPDIPDGMFEFEAPDGAVEIDFLFDAQR